MNYTAITRALKTGTTEEAVEAFEILRRDFSRAVSGHGLPAKVSKSAMRRAVIAGLDRTASARVHGEDFPQRWLPAHRDSYLILLDEAAKS